MITLATLWRTPFMFERFVRAGVLSLGLSLGLSVAFQPSLARADDEVTIAESDLDEAKRIVQSKQEELRNLLVSGAKDEELHKKLNETLDYESFAQRVFGRCASLCEGRTDHWSKIEEDSVKKAEIHELVKKYIRKHYLKKLKKAAKNGKYDVKILRAVALSGGTIRVNTELTFGNDSREAPLRISYLLWRGKIIDILTEGVPISKSWHKRVDKEMQAGGYDAVVKWLKDASK